VPELHDAERGDVQVLRSLRNAARRDGCAGAGSADSAEAVCAARRRARAETAGFAGARSQTCRSRRETVRSAAGCDR